MRRTHVVGRSIVVGGVVAAGLAMSRTAFAATYQVNTTAAQDGGGLWNSAPGTMVVTDSQATGNTAGRFGDNVYQEPPGMGFTYNGMPVPPGDNNI